MDMKKIGTVSSARDKRVVRTGRERRSFILVDFVVSIE